MEHLFQLEPSTLLVERYYIVKRLGGGGMGSVYLARDKRLAEAPRAVKEMIGTYSEESQRKKVIEDFERESQLLASLDHPAIPTIFDYFVTEGCYYLVMKYISGGDLSTRLKEAPDGRIDERTVTEWGMQIADVLSYLHSQNPPIIYRDMKPANVMIDERDRIVLVDFGIARFVAATQKNVTAIGTMGYAPPELFAGKVEPRSDIYSLGATMFHLLTGRDPQDNPLLMFDFNRNPRPKQINPKISDEMDAILARAVDHKPVNRFASAAEMKKVLEEHLRRITSREDRERVEPMPEGESASGETIFCGQCGQKLKPENHFCANCGAPCKTGTPSTSASVPSALSASLVLIGANKQPISFIISKDNNLVGRLDTNRGIFPDIDLSPYDKEGKISRRHAVIHRANDKYTLEDLGSTNGTTINDSDRLEPKKVYEIKSGDDVQLGELAMKFFIGAVPVMIPASAVEAAASKPSPGIITYKNTPEGMRASGPVPVGFPTKVPSSSGSGAIPVVKAEIAEVSAKVPDIAASVSKSTVGRSSESNGSIKLPPSESRKVTFLTNVDFTKQVKLNSTIPLQVGMLNMKDSSILVGNGKIEKLHEHDNELTIAFTKENQREVQVDVYVAAPGFEIEPDIFARIAAPMTGNAPSRIFQLKAVQVGTTTVTIDFYQDSDYLSSVTLETEVIE